MWEPETCHRYHVFNTAAGGISSISTGIVLSFFLRHSARKWPNTYDGATEMTDEHSKRSFRALNWCRGKGKGKKKKKKKASGWRTTQCGLSAFPWKHVLPSDVQPSGQLSCFLSWNEISAAWRRTVELLNKRLLCAHTVPDSAAPCSFRRKTKQKKKEKKLSKKKITLWQPFEVWKFPSLKA